MSKWALSLILFDSAGQSGYISFMGIRRSLLLGALCLLLAGCAAGMFHFSPSKTAYLSQGMTKSSVLKLLGKPYSTFSYTTVDGILEVWEYREPAGGEGWISPESERIYQVRFLDGTVRQWGKLTQLQEIERKQKAGQ